MSAPRPLVNSITLSLGLPPLPNVFVLNAWSAPISFAIFTLSSITSKAIIWLAPDILESAMAPSPIGPAPYMTTVAPGLNPLPAIKIPLYAQPTGSIRAPKSKTSSPVYISVKALISQQYLSFTAIYSAKAPFVLSPINSIFSHWLGNPLLHGRHLPHHMILSTATLSPLFRFFTLLPVFSTMPENSWPIIHGNLVKPEKIMYPSSSVSYKWVSEPQTPQVFTFMRTSSSWRFGVGTSFTSNVMFFHT